MNAVASILGLDPEPHPMRDGFLRWQCRVRQIAMRENFGRPDDAIMPSVTIDGDPEPLGHIITVLNKTPAKSETPELMHMAKRTHDPAQRREKAIEYFSSTYFQKARSFSDILTASFPENSEGAMKIRRAETCVLGFDAYGQRFELHCKVWRLARRNPFHAATWWHNHLFNPRLSEEAVILGFEPDWTKSTADPKVT